MMISGIHIDDKRAAQKNKNTKNGEKKPKYADTIQMKDRIPNSAKKIIFLPVWHLLSIHNSLVQTLEKE